MPPTTSDPPAAAVLAAAAAGTRIDEVAPGVRDRVLDVFVDTLGVMAIGSGRPEHTTLRALWGAGTGAATVVGSAEPAAAPVAALLNGTTPSVYQIDEGHRESRGHPGIHVVPAVLALAEERGDTVDRMLSALLAGYEVAVRVGRSLGPIRPTIHPHGNWGTIGAAVATAHLVSDGDAGVIASAIDGAAAVTLFPDRVATTHGAGVHHLYAALGTHAGMVAGCAAASGMSSVPGCLERFFCPSSGSAFDAGSLLTGVDASTGRWSTFEISHGYVKFLPACAHTHTVLNAVLSLRRDEPFEPSAVERIDVRAFRAAANLGSHTVDNDLAARYNIPFTVAAAIVTGEFTLDSLRDEVLGDPAVRETAGRVHVRHDPDLDAGYPADGRPVVVTVRLTDGRVLERSMRLSYGDDEQRADRAAVHEKARALLRHRFGGAAADDVLDAALALRGDDRLGPLSQALRAAAVHRRQRRESR